MSNSDYWNNRFAEHGHTGYKDKFIYSWDQEVRKKIVGKYIQKHTSNRSNSKHRILDFGCGVGDFSQMMLEKGFDVTAVDISKDVVKFIETRFGKDIKAIAGGRPALEKMEGGYSVIFCITVLQHIEKNNDVGNTLDQFYRLLVDNGVLIVLELSKQEGNADETGAYLFGRSERSWLSIFDSHKFVVKEMVTYPQTAVKLIAQIQHFRHVLFPKRKNIEVAENNRQQSSETPPSSPIRKSVIRVIVKKFMQAFVMAIAFVPDKILRTNIYRESNLPYRLFVLEKR